MTHQSTTSQLIDLSKQSWSNFQKRREIEWKFNFTVWAGIAALDVALLSQKIRITSPAWIILLGGTIVFAVHFVWLQAIRKRNRLDQRFAIHFERMALSHIGIGLPDEITSLKKEIFKPFRPLKWLEKWKMTRTIADWKVGRDQWSNACVLSITGLLIVASSSFISAASGAGTEASTVESSGTRQVRSGNVGGNTVNSPKESALLERGITALAAALIAVIVVEFFRRKSRWEGYSTIRWQRELQLWGTALSHARRCVAYSLHERKKVKKFHKEFKNCRDSFSSCVSEAFAIAGQELLEAALRLEQQFADIYHGKDNPDVHSTYQAFVEELRRVLRTDQLSEQIARILPDVQEDVTESDSRDAPVG